MEISKQIDRITQSIHASDIYGCFVEMGCGVAVTNALMGVSGATATVYAAECPYAKEYQYENYDNAGHRAVSKESVDKILKTWVSKYEYDEGNGNRIVNSFYVASFQLGNGNDVSTHGWIAYQYAGILRYYHISIHEPMSRKEYLDKIALCGLSIIIGRNKLVIQDACIDIVEGFDDDLVEAFEMVGHTADEQFICVRDGKMHRMEDFFRDEKAILIIKGSFNPIHLGHLDIASAMQSMSGSKPKLMISAEIFGKGTVDPREMKSRVEDLNKLGFDVIVSRSGFFNDNIKYIRKKFKQPIIFGVGADTLIRVFQSTYPILNGDPDAFKEFVLEFDAKFMVAMRDGYEIPKELDIISQYLITCTIKHSGASSTKIRNGADADNIPEQLRDKYKKQ